MFRKIKNIVHYWLKYLFKPGMIYGIKHGGVYLKNTRISNTTIIENADKLSLSDNVFIGHHNFIEASNEIAIGEGCQITNFISIISHSSHNSIRLYGKVYRDYKEHEGYIKGRISIGPYTFVGPHSLIMPNTSIGKGCLIQAYSYVKGNFPDFSILGGNPAKVIGDTRESDKECLKNHPELETYYKEWQKEKK